jgi:hypothetical protein
VDTVQALPEFEKTLEISMIERELRFMPEMGRLFRAQRDEAVAALAAQMHLSSQPTVNHRYFG